MMIEHTAFRDPKWKVVIATPYPPSQKRWCGAPSGGSADPRRMDKLC